MYYKILSWIKKLLLVIICLQLAACFNKSKIRENTDAKNKQEIVKNDSTANNLLTKIAGKNKIQKTEDETLETPEEINQNAIALLKKRKYSKAKKLFDMVDLEYPYSDVAPNANLISAFLSYLQGEYQQSYSKFDAFITLNGSSPYLDYAYYMKAISLFYQTNKKDKSQNVTEQAITELKQVIAYSPNSPYAKDAKKKIIILQDKKVGHSIYVASFYHKNKDYMPAIKRYYEIITDYPESRYSALAHIRIAESFYALGVIHQAKYYYALYKKKFPKSKLKTRLTVLLIQEHEAEKKRKLRAKFEARMKKIEQERRKKFNKKNKKRIKKMKI